ncbi:MAG: hydroxyacid dehydrogenase [Actinomycetota bacterium]|nr:hydroxyacid dehydrogenase [Actinomycetota bacterium]
MSPPAPELLSGFGELVVAREDDERALIQLVRDAVGLVVRGGSRVTARVIDAAPSLRVIGRSGVGYDEIDLAAATRRGIPVVITPQAGAQAVAEGAMAMLLPLAKGLPLLDRAVREGRWRVRDDVEVDDLEGSTLGIVGLGRIGRRVAALARAFGMRILAFDPYVEAAGDVELVDVRTLFAESNFVSLHAPLTSETNGLVDAHLLDVARAGLVLVNLSRGALVRSLDDLLAALESGRLGGVGLDVFDPEPPDVSHPLFRHPRVLLAPHALGMTRRSRERIFREMAEGMAAVLRGGRAPTLANPEIYGR